MAHALTRAGLRFLFLTFTTFTTGTITMGQVAAAPTLTMPYSDQNCRCAVRLPAMPTVQHMSSPGSDGNSIDVTDVNAEAPQPGDTFGLAYWQLPRGTTYDQQAGINGIVHNANGTEVIGGRPESFRGYPSRSVIFRSNPSTIVRAMVVTARGEVYSLSTTAATRREADAAFSAFTNSFQFTH